MTRQEATDFIEKMKEMYGDEYREELARRTGCNPDNYDDYGLVYCMQFNTMSRGRVAPRARAMKGHGQDLFRESIQRTTKKVRLTEGDLRRIVKKSVNRILKESEDQLNGSDQKIYDACVYILSQTEGSRTINDILSDTIVSDLTYAEAEAVCNILDAYAFGTDTIYDDGVGNKNSMVNQHIVNMLRNNVG